MPMASVPGRPRRNRQDAIGSISIRPGRAEGRAFNNFPAIAAAFPEILSAIVIETTEELGALAESTAPVQPTRGRHWKPGDPAPGTLKRSKRVRFAKRRGTDLVISGRVDFKATDPTAADPKHSFAKAVEVGSTRTRGRGRGHYRVPAQPFLAPAVEHERPLFIARIKDLESRLPK